jgi:hypothetical protein
MAQTPHMKASEDAAWPSQECDVTDQRHALYAMVRLLDLLKLSGWSHTLLLWLANYDGFEAYIPDEDDPVVRLRTLLGDYVTRGKAPEMGRIAVDLCDVQRMPFLLHRAAWVNDTQEQRTRRNWMPLQQPWLEFVAARDPGEDLHVWAACEPFPPPDVLRLHLLRGYVLQNRLP